MKVFIYVTVCLKNSYMGLSVFYFYRCCIILVSQFNWFMLRVFNLKMKNLAVDTSKLSQIQCQVFYDELTHYHTCSIIALYL